MIAPAPSPADEAIAEFLASLAMVKARRAQGTLLARSSAIDGHRLANAFRAKPRRVAPIAPTRRAASADAICPSCAARGERGCGHFLPFDGDDA